MASRQKTTQEIADVFKTNFARVLGARLEPSQELSPKTPAELLCALYDALPHSKKRGIWPEVAMGLGRDEKWAAKHYLNCFRRALYPEELTQQNKQQIVDLIKKLRKEHYDKHSIVEEAKKMFVNTKIFPDAVQSYVFQSIVREEREQQMLYPQYCNGYGHRNSSLFPDTRPNNMYQQHPSQYQQQYYPENNKQVNFKPFDSSQLQNINSQQQQQLVQDNYLQQLNRFSQQQSQEVQMNPSQFSQPAPQVDFIQQPQQLQQVKEILNQQNQQQQNQQLQVQVQKSLSASQEDDGEPSETTKQMKQIFSAQNVYQPSQQSGISKVLHQIQSSTNCKNDEEKMQMLSTAFQIFSTTQYNGTFGQDYDNGGFGEQ